MQIISIQIERRCKKWPKRKIPIVAEVACWNRRKAPRPQSRRFRSLRSRRTNWLWKRWILTGVGEDIFSYPGRSMYKGQPISVRGIQKRIEFYDKETTIKVSCHRLRHTMATQLLNVEAEIETIQDLLGHTWIATTQKYCKLSNLKVQRDYFKAMRRVQQRYVQPAINPMLDHG